MYGPKPAGTWSQHTSVPAGTPYRHLIPGQRYQVATPFTDFDGDTHDTGEVWTFVGWSYLPYDRGLSLFVSRNGDDEWHIRLMCVPEEQGPIVDRLADYVVPVTA